VFIDRLSHILKLAIPFRDALIQLVTDRYLYFDVFDLSLDFVGVVHGFLPLARLRLDVRPFMKIYARMFALLYVSMCRVSIGSVDSKDHEHLGSRQAARQMNGDFKHPSLSSCPLPLSLL
jgi:hypothetical protein